MRARIVPELGNEWVTLERLLYDAALHPLAATVNETHFAKTGLARRGHVLFDDRLHITGQERVEIDRGFDRNVVGRVRIQGPKPVGVYDFS